ncbi:hypothetical protein Tco_1254071, partial [Tanacetum coccineum]
MHQFYQRHPSEYRWTKDHLLEQVRVIMEYLVKDSKRRAFWSLNEDILKITILKTNTPYPSRKIRRIRACTHQRPQRNEDQYAVSRRCQYAVLKIMTKVIKGEFEKIKYVKVEDVTLTCDTPLEVFNNEVNRLSGRDDEVELTNEESSYDKDEVAETYLLRTLRDSRPMKITRMIGSMNGTRTYHSWMDDGYCNGGNLPRTYIIGNQLHYQDNKWYEALKDSELKDEALRNKAIMEGLIKEYDDESRYEHMRRWNINANYDDAYETNHENNEKEEL